ncbi:hypothetical protein ACFL34_03255 [Candidatus Sumerlaeota bacterium]
MKTIAHGLTFGLALLLLQGCTSMRHDIWDGIYDVNEDLWEYNLAQGKFVAVPMVIGTVVGVPTAVLAPAIWILTAPSGSGGEEIVLLLSPLLFFPQLVGNVVALPFWSVKKVFFDCPKSLFLSPPPTPAETKEEMQTEEEMSRTGE